MGTRFYSAAIVLFWMIAMGWLAATKLLPLLQSGDPPDYTSLAPRPGDTTQVDVWQLRYKEVPIGWAISRAERQADGRTQFKSLVHLAKLPLDRMLNDTFLWLRPLIPTNVEGEPIDMPELALRTRVAIDADGGLQQFETTLDIAEVTALARIEGRVVERSLELKVFVRSGIDAADRPTETVALEQAFDLPSREFVTGSLSPQPRLDNLKVGQTWTLRTYRLMPQDSPLQVVQARVEREDLLVWEGEPTPALLVSYRDDGGSGITAAREPFARLWVLADGRVVQQEVTFANLQITFYRMAARHDDPRLRLLDRPLYESTFPAPAKRLAP